MRRRLATTDGTVGVARAALEMDPGGEGEKRKKKKDCI